MAKKLDLLDINGFLNSYKTKSQESVLNGEYYQFDSDKRASNTKFMDSRSKEEQQQFIDYTKRAKEKELTISHLLDTLDNKARTYGLRLYFQESGRKDNTWNVYYVPTEDYQTKIVGQSKKAIDEYLGSIAKFNFSEVDAEGLININGQKVINQLIKDRVDEETVIITMLEKQLLEQNRLFDIKKNGGDTPFLRNLKKLNNTQDSKERSDLLKKLKNSANFVDKTVKEGGVASSNFRGLREEFAKARQGVGSTKSLAIRQGFIDQKPFIDRIIEENYQVINKYQKQFNGIREVTYNRAKESMAHDIMQIFAMYAQATDPENVEREIGQLENFSYLKNTALLKAIKEEGRAINKSHPYIGTSQEGSVDNFLLSYFRASDIDFFGGLDDKTNRKRVQTTNTLERTKKAKELLKNITKQRKVYTKMDSIRGFTNGEDEFNRMYSEGYLTQKEIYDAIKKIDGELAAENFHKSAREGGNFIAESIASSLTSEQKRTATVDAKKFTEKYRWAKNKYKNEHLTKEQLKQITAIYLLKELGVTEAEVDKNGKINPASLIKIGTNKFVDISKNLDYNNKEQKVLSFSEKHSAHDGAKVLGSDFNLKGSVQTLKDEYIKQALKNRGWTNEEITKYGYQIIRNPENLSIRNLSGILGSYVENVFEAISDSGVTNEALLKEMQGSNLLKEWLTSDENGVLRVNKDIFEKTENKNLSEKTLLKFIPEFNKIKNKYFGKGIYSHDVFTVDKKGLHFNPLKYIGSTSAGIAAQSEWGAPGPDKKNLNVDYRYTGAVDRGTIAASLATGKDLSLINRYFLGDRKQEINKQGEIVYAPVLTGEGKDRKFQHAGIYSGDIVDQKNYLDFQKQVEEVEKVRNNSILKDSEDIDPIEQLLQFTKEGRGIVGYGDVDTFIKNYQETIIDRKLKLAKQEEERNNIKEEWNLIVDYLKKEGKTKYFDLSQEFEDWIYEDGKVTKDSFKASMLGKLFEAQNKSKGNLVYIPSSGGYFSRSGNKAIAGNIVELADLGILNPNLLDKKATSYPVTDVYKGIYNIKRAEEEAAILREQREDHNPDADAEFTNKQKLSDAIADFYATMKDTVMNKEGSLWQKANKIAIGHSMFGSAVSGAVIDNKKYDENNSYLRDINESGAAVNNRDLKQLLLKDVDAKGEDYVEALKLNYHYLWDDAYDKGYEEVEAKLNEELKNTKTASEKIKLLVNQIVQAVTIGSDVFNKRLEEVTKRGGVFRGVNSNIVRFPLSNGLDVQTAELFADTQLDRGSIRAGTGIGKGVNLDFDGDKLNVSLNITNAELAKEIGGVASPDDATNSKEFLDQMKTLNDFYKSINSAIGYIETRSVLDIDSKDKGKGKLFKKDDNLEVTLSKDELKGLFNDEAQQTSAVLSRLNKKYTGIASNNYQAVAEALSSISPRGGDVLPKSEEAKKRFVNDMITRGLFEAFTQDAISSKKVVTRITKESLKTGAYGGDWTNNAEFYKELQDIIDTFKQSDTYSSSERFNRALQKGINMGVFDEKDMLASRITARILATTQRLYTDKEGNLDEEKYAKALGLSVEEARKRMFDYNKKNQVIGYKYYTDKKNKEIDPEERGITQEMVSKSVLESDAALKEQGNRGGIAGAQIQKAKYIPGNANASTAPVYRIGKVTYTQSEINRLKLVNPAIGDLAGSYDDLKDKANAAAKALEKEAEAEQNKIGIANTEAKAINEGSKAYAEREKILSQLGARHKKGTDPFVTSESSDLNIIFGNKYLDTKPFEKSIIEAYHRISETTNGNVPKDFIATPESLGWTLEVGEEASSAQQARFNDFKKGVWAPLQGRIADSLEQVLSEVNIGLEEIDGDLAVRVDSYEKLKNFLDKQNGFQDYGEEYDKLRKAIRLNLASGVKGAEGVDYLLGRVNYGDKSLTAKDLLPDNDKKEWVINGETYKTRKAAFAALKEGNDNNAILFKGLFGDQAERYKRYSTGIGEMMFQGTLGATEGDLARIGPKEFKIAYLKAGENRFTQGRADTITYDVQKAHTKGLFGDFYDEDKGVISVFDKKFTDSVEATPRYIAQVLDYINGLKQLQDTVKKSKGGFKKLNKEQLEQEIEDFKDTELGYAYSDIFGEDYLDSKEFKDVYKRLRRGDVVNGGLLLTNSFGQNTRLNFGYSGLDGSFHMTGDPKVDKSIFAYLNSRTEIESWDELTKERFLAMAKKDTSAGANKGKKLSFTKGEEGWSFLADEQVWNTYIKNKRQLSKVTNRIHSLLKKDKLSDTQKFNLKELQDVQKDLQETIDVTDEKLIEAENNLEPEQKNSESYKTLKSSRDEVLEKISKNTEGLEIEYQDFLDIQKQYFDTKGLLEKTYLEELKEGNLGELDERVKDFTDLSPETQAMVESLKGDLKKLWDRMKPFSGEDSSNFTEEQKENTQKFLGSEENRFDKVIEQVQTKVAGDKNKIAEEARVAIYKEGAKQLILEQEKNVLNEILSNHSDTLDSDQKRDIENRIREIDVELKNKVEEQIEKYKNIIQKYTPDSDDITDFEAYIKEGQEKNNDKTSRLAEERIYQGKKTKEQEYLGLYRGVNARKEDLDALNKRISKTTDPVERKLLEMDRKDAEELLKQAELRIETHKTTLGRSENADYLNSIDKDAQLRASLEYQQASEYKEKTRVRAPGLIGMATNSVGNTVAGMGHGFGTYQLLQKFMQTISKVVSSAKALDQTLTNLRIVTSDTKENTRGLVSEYANLANSLGATTQAVSTSAVEWLRQGYSISESMDLVKSSMYLSTLGMIDSASATQSLTSALKGFKLEATESMDIVDKLTALDLKAATSAGDIAQGLSQFANLGSLAGVNIDEAAAYVATISDVTQMTGSSAGQALKTIISRYGNVKAGSYNKLNVNSDGTDDSTTVNDVENVLKKLGISIRSSTLQFRDFDEVLSEIAEKWDSLDTVSQKAVATSFAGVRQQEAFVTLMQNWDKYESLLETSKNSSGTAEKKYQTYQESLAASLNKLASSWENFANSYEISEVLRFIYESLNTIAEQLPTIVKWLPQAVFAIDDFQAFRGNSIWQKGFRALGENKNIISLSEKWQQDTSPDGKHGKAFRLGRAALNAIFGEKYKSDDSNLITDEKENVKIVEESKPQGDSSDDSNLITDEKEKVEIVEESKPQGDSIPQEDNNSTLDNPYLLNINKDGIEGYKTQGDSIPQEYNNSTVSTIRNDYPSDLDNPYLLNINKEEIEGYKPQGYSIPQEYNNSTVSTIRNSYSSGLDNPYLFNINKDETGYLIPQEDNNYLIRNYDSSYSTHPAYLAIEEEEEKSLGRQTLKNLSKRRNYEDRFLVPEKDKEDKTTFSGVEKLESTVTKEKEKQAELAEKETEAKKEVLNAAKKEAENKKEQLQNSEQEKANSNVTAQNSDKEAANSKKEVIDDQTKNNLSKQDVNNAKLKGNYEEKGTNEVKEKAAVEAGITDNVKNKKGLSGLLSGLGGAGAKGIGGIGTAISVAMNSILSFVTTLQTAGNTHTRIGADGEEESANSSAKAKNAGKWIAAGFSLIPVIGTLIGDKVSNDVMAAIDAEKDYAEVTAEKAEDIISVLNSVESDISTITSTIGSIDSSDLQERMDAVQSLIETLYTSENSDTRSLLETELRNIYGDSSVTLYSVLKDILSSNSEVSEKATKSLEYAQAILEVNQQQLAKASDDYNEREDFKDTVSSLFSTDDVDSIVSSPTEFKEQLQQKQAEYVEEMSQEGISKEEKTKYEAALDKISKLLTATDTYISYLQSNIDTYNKNYAAAQLKKATTEDGKYLTNLNISELKSLGASEIYERYAEAIGARGLKGINTYNYYDKNGNIITGKSDEELEEMFKNGTATRELSESFKEAAKTAFKGDEEIWSAVSGSSYTLEGALKALDPGNWADREILQNFADALGTTVENLSQYTDKIGKLKYSEILKSTSELLEEQESYLDLMTDISDSTKSATEWMNTIINNYPELIGYMSDTPALMEQIMTKIKQLAEYEITTQRSAIANSSAAFKSDDPTVNTLVKSMLDSAGDDKDKLQTIIDKSGAKNFNGLITYLKGLDENTEEYKLLYEAISKAGSSYTLTSDAYKSALQNYISYNSTLLENQINNLTAQKEALQQITSQREYENKLIEAKLALEDAINNKKRVYRAGVGFVYETDQEAISSAEDNLKEVQVEKDVSAIQKQIDTLQKQKDDWDNIWDKKNFELLEQQALAFEKEFLNQNETIISGFDDVSLQEKISNGEIEGIKGFITDENGKITKLIGSDNETIYDVAKDNNDKIIGYFNENGSITSILEGVESGLSQEQLKKNITEGVYPNIKNYIESANGAITGLIGTKGETYKAITDVNGKIIGYLDDEGGVTSLIGDSKTNLDDINTSTSGFAGTITTMWDRLSKITSESDGITISFSKETENYLQQQLGKLKEDEDKKEENTVKAEKIKAVKDAWDNFNKVSQNSSKGSLEYNNALKAYKTAFDEAKTAGFINDTSDGDESTSNDWTREGEDFGSKKSLDAYKEKIENSEAIDKEAGKIDNPYWGKAIFTYTQKGENDPLYWSPYTAMLTSTSKFPTEVPDNVRNDLNNKEVRRLIDLEGGQQIGRIDSTARSWESDTNNWNDLSKIPNGIYASGDGFGTAFFLINDGYYYNLQRQNNFSNYSRLAEEVGKQWDIKGNTNGKWVEMDRSIAQSIASTYRISDALKKYSSDIIPHQFGIYSTPRDEQALVNEIGTEAIITPNGTLTALPAHTGIVPADITKNLWSLGEVAPSILRVIDNINPNAASKFVNNANNSSVDESVNMPNATFTFNVTDKFDIDDFIDAVQSSAHRRKNLK